MAARVGIDLGTTNTVVALVDRGNYPVLPVSVGGEARLSTPTLLSWRGDEVRLGWDALHVWGLPDWELFSSPKRWLGVPSPPIPVGPAGSLDSEHGKNSGARMEDILRLFFRRLRDDILASPHVEADLGPDDEIEAMIGVPANANSLQRYRTLSAARQAGFRVLGLLHEPTAAAIEYAHRHPAFGRGKERRHVLVYDLGGGTFDVAIVRIDPDGFYVVRSAGVERLGGDDFDRILAEMALQKAGLSYDDLPWNAQHRLLLRCRELKESIRGTTKKVLVDLEDLGAGEAAIFTAEYYERCQPLVTQTIETLSAVMSDSQLDFAQLDALLLVGGGSQMHLVQRQLKERVGARLKISPHPFASTAVGLAIHADRSEVAPVKDRFARHFGVWRESEAGERKSFDTIFGRDTALPPLGETLLVKRIYHPAHNIGHFRYEECATLDAAGTPVGHHTPWCEIHFPFDPALAGSDRLDLEAVQRTERFSGSLVEERYECDSQGLITVRLLRFEPPLSCSYLLHGPEQVTPTRPSPARTSNRSTPDTAPSPPSA